MPNIHINRRVSIYKRPAVVSSGSPDTTNLWSWVKADAGTYSDTSLTTPETTNGNSVQGWQDQSGNNRHWTFVTGVDGPNYASNSINSKPTLHFTAATQESLTCNTDMSGLTAGHVFCIVAVDNEASDRHLWRMGTSAQGMFYPFSGDSIIYDDWGGTARRAFGDPTPALTGYRCYEVISTSSEHTALIDGTQLGTFGTNTVGFHATPRIGADVTPAYFTGDVAEMLIYSAKISGSNRSTTVSYLNNKYALSIS